MHGDYRRGQKIFQCIDELGGLVDSSIIIQVVLASRRKNILRWGVERLPSYGAMRGERGRIFV
ncbi:MAG: hypothetical protein LBM95_08205 [Lactobacillales bacterium]|nr:hypothetical protein [Lactobacillales bacterium]